MVTEVFAAYLTSPWEGGVRALALLAKQPSLSYPGKCFCVSFPLCLILEKKIGFSLCDLRV